MHRRRRPRRDGSRPAPHGRARGALSGGRAGRQGGPAAAPVAAHGMGRHEQRPVPRLRAGMPADQPGVPLGGARDRDGEDGGRLRAHLHAGSPPDDGPGLGAGRHAADWGGSGVDPERPGDVRGRRDPAGGAAVRVRREERTPIPSRAALPVERRSRPRPRLARRRRLAAHRRLSAGGFRVRSRGRCRARADRGRRDPVVRAAGEDLDARARRPASHVPGQVLLRLLRVARRPAGGRTRQDGARELVPGAASGGRRVSCRGSSLPTAPSARTPSPTARGSRSRPRAEICSRGCSSSSSISGSRAA